MTPEPTAPRTLRGDPVRLVIENTLSLEHLIEHHDNIG